MNHNACAAKATGLACGLLAPPAVLQHLNSRHPQALVWLHEHSLFFSSNAGTGGAGSGEASGEQAHDHHDGASRDDSGRGNFSSVVGGTGASGSDDVGARDSDDELWELGVGKDNEEEYSVGPGGE